MRVVKLETMRITIERIPAPMASLTLFERLMYMLFPLFTLINPSQTYKRDQVVAMISDTPFSEYLIKEENNELQIKLKK